MTDEDVTAEIENVAALLKRTWAGGGDGPVAGVLDKAAALIRKQASALASVRSAALEEAAKIAEGFETIGDAIGPAHHQGKAYAARAIAGTIRSLTTPEDARAT